MKKSMALIFIFIMCMGLVSCNTPEAEKTPFEFSYAAYCPVYYDSKYIYMPQSEFDVLTNEQQNALIATKSTEVRRYWWLEKYILGEINENERLDLDTAKNILQKYDEDTDTRVILQEFAKIQKYPDDCGGSGISSVHYNIKEQPPFNPRDYTNATTITIFNGFVVIRYYDENGEQISAEGYKFSSGDASPIN